MFSLPHARSFEIVCETTLACRLSRERLKNSRSSNSNILVLIKARPRTRKRQRTRHLMRSLRVTMKRMPKATEMLKMAKRMSLISMT